MKCQYCKEDVRLGQDWIDHGYNCEEKKAVLKDMSSFKNPPVDEIIEALLPVVLDDIKKNGPLPPLDNKEKESKPKKKGKSKK